MFKALWLAGWKNQTPYTRIAVSLALALASTLSSYLLIMGGPSLVEVHAWLYSHFETQSAIQSMVFRGFIAYVMLAQVAIAVACVSEPHPGPKGLWTKTRTSSNLAFYLALGLLGFAAVLAPSWFLPDFFTGKDYPNGELSFAIALHVFLCLFAIVVPVLCVGPERAANNVFAFTAAKCVVGVVLFCCEPSSLHLTMLLGMCVLDYLLHAIGQPKPAVSESATKDSVNAETAPGAERAVQLNKTVV